MVKNLFQGNSTRRDLALIMMLLFIAPLVTSNYYTFLIGSALIFVIYAIALDLAWGYAGILSLGHSVFFGLGAYTYAIIAINGNSTLSIVLGAVLGVILPAVLALLVGWFLFYIKSSPFYIGIVTLSLTIIFEQLALSLVDLTGGQNGLTNVPGYPFSGSTLYYFLFFVLLAVLVGVYKFTRSDMGKLVVAVRDNEERSQFIGYNTPLIRTIVMIISASIAGFAGVLYAPYDAFVSPSLISFVLATQVVIWVAIGGRGKIVGAVIGALLINILSPTFNTMFPEIWQIFLGLLFILVVVFVPNGLYSFIRKKEDTKGNIELVQKDNAIQETTFKEKDSIVEIDELKVSFGSLNILKGVTLNLRRGEVHCIIGPNGAGKSTLINAITGRNKPTSGKVRFKGKEINSLTPQDIVSDGIARTFQATNIIGSLSVAENLRLASKKGKLPSIFNQTSKVYLSESTMELINQTGLNNKLNEIAGNLSHGDQQSLELCMVLALEPDVMLLDEPTAGLTALERKKVGKMFQELSHKKGISLLIIEHDIDFVKEIADRVTVLHFGKIVADASVDEVINSELVKEIYLGGS